ncbi:MAG: RrF2 family transcriptional regulator [Anaerolineae bacterium]|jgi:Rrf2 family protein
MVLNKGTYWALKALIYLASQPPGAAPHLAAEVATAVGAPAPTTAKVLRRLSLAGILVSLRGPKGGFMLARSPQDLTVYDVVQALDGHSPETQQSPEQPSDPAQAGLEAFISATREKVSAAMRATTIAELLELGRQ